MARQNYQHEKRLRDLAKKKKQEEKRQKKMNKGSQPAEPAGEETPQKDDSTPQS